MRKMFLLFGMLAMVGVLFVACSDQQDLTSPEEAVFGKKVENNCTGLNLEMKDAIDAEIDIVLSLRKSRKGAHQIVDNIARKVCAGDVVSTQNMIDDFEILLDRQPVDQIEGGVEAAARLFAAVSAFGSGIVFPAEALNSTGTVAIVEPGEDAEVVTPNREAALVVDPASFGPGDPVTVILTRIDDDQAPIPGFTNFAERYEVFVSRSPLATGDGVLVAVCVPDDQVTPGELALGHLYNGMVEILVPVDPGDLLDCDDAETGYPFVGDALASRSIGRRLLQPVIDRLLGVKPLNAMYFGGTGLGGRTKSFSPFAPVDPTIEVGETVQLTIGTDDVDWSSHNEAVATVDDYGLVTGVIAGIAEIEALVDDMAYTIDITVESPNVGTLPILCSAEPAGGDRYFRGFYIPSYPGDFLAYVGLHLSADIEGSYTMRLTAFDGTYDGTMIGSAEASRYLNGRSNYLATGFTFGFRAPLPVTPGNTVAFRLEYVDGPDAVDPNNILVFYKVPSNGDVSCPVVETNGTTTPLDTFRRTGIWVSVYDELLD